MCSYPVFHNIIEILICLTGVYSCAVSIGIILFILRDEMIDLLRKF